MNKENKPLEIRKNVTMTRDDIMRLIPHRPPMLLVDTITIDDNDVAHAIYLVRGDEFFLQGHFPGNPVVPGVILCEIMAQSSCPLIGDRLIGTTPFYAGINNVKFKKQVKPGDEIKITAEITNSRGMVFFVKAKAEVDGTLCVQGELIFALVKNENLQINM
ncbi:MAG: 3-hydroxyacyl-ACP dehydratase FabZ [Bacteroidales bacterium]|nr:3-hydroxyacyl-ACP dehydratase FabZ [Bacteroidales bacterium]